MESHHEDGVEAEVLTRGLRILIMLPALEVLCLEASHATWSNAALEAFVALCRSKPALTIATAESARSYWPWPDTKAMFDFCCL